MTEVARNRLLPAELLPQAVHVVGADFVAAGSAGPLVPFATGGIGHCAAIDRRHFPFGALAKVPAEQAGAFAGCLLALFTLLPVGHVGAVETALLLPDASGKCRTRLIAADASCQFIGFARFGLCRQAQDRCQQCATEHRRKAWFHRVFP